MFCQPACQRLPQGLAAFLACCVAAAAATAAGVSRAAGSAVSPAGGISAGRVDPAVVPAGGGSCTACGPGGCRQVSGGLHGHHAGCRDGVCVPYCPVRPQQFGYYGTRWRRWPGQEIVQVSDERAAAPAQPPRSAVPGADEESMAPRTIEPPADVRGAEEPAALPEPERSPPRREPLIAPEPEPEPELRPEPRPAPPPAIEPGPEPAAEPAREAKPAAEPEPAKEDENLFEVLSGTGWRARRRFAASTSGDGVTADSVQPVRHVAPADPRDVPRVNFDPAAETRRLRSVR